MSHLSLALRKFSSRTPNIVLIAVFGLCVTAAAWFSVFYLTGYERAEEIKRFDRDNGAQARAFEEHTRRVLKAADNALLYLQSEYHKNGRVTESMVNFIDWFKRDASINQLAVADSAGNLMVSAAQSEAPVNIADRPHFRVHLENPDQGLFISQPLVTRVTGTWSFFLSRRLSAPDGSFRGVVSVGLAPSYFSDYYDTLSLGKDRSMMLIGLDGIVRCWRFNSQMVVGRDLTKSPLFAQVRRARVGSYEVNSSIDGQKRWSSYRVMADYPLIAVVAELKDSALASYTSRKRSYYIFTTVFTLFVASFCLLLIRAEGRTRSQSERIAEELARRERTAEALRESQDLFAQFLDHLPAVAFVKDLEETVQYSNQAFKDLFGHDMIGRNLLELPALHGGLAAQGSREQAILGGKPGSAEETVVDLQGRERTFDTRRFVVQREGKQPLVGVIAVDISGRRHGQKLEAIGTLAGGVAHDFNNILTAIIGCGQLMQMKLSEGDTLRGYVDQILAAGDRAAQLTGRLLAFGRKQESVLKEADLNEVFRSMERLLRRLIREDQEFRVELSGSGLTVMADSGQLEQVLMNLAINARDAMSEAGVLTVRTERCTMDDAFVQQHLFGRPGEYGVISVSDTGTGMEMQTQRRIFEPFFTTKEVGKGTGLGLSMVYGIIQQHDGFIDVHSELGVGTTFRVYLPLVAEAVPQPELPLPGPMHGGSETILLAEDDAQVRAMTKDVLEEFGYRVIEAEDGEQAVTCFGAHAKTIHLVILDVIMPRKNGKEAYEEIRRMAPEIKVLFTSGYTADVISRKGILDERLHFLAKPLAPQTLLRKLREILDQPC